MIDRDSPPLPARAWTLGRALPVAAVLGAVGLLLVFPLVEYDTFWHLAYGRAMVDARAILEREVLTYTNPGYPFANHSWLAQLALYGAWALAGANGLVALRVAAGLGVALILIASGRRLAATPLVTALLVLWGFAGAIDRFSPRPELFSLLGLALLGLLLDSYRSRPSRAVLWALPLLLTAWDTLHGAILGAIFLLAFLAAEASK